MPERDYIRADAEGRVRPSQPRESSGLPSAFFVTACVIALILYYAWPFVVFLGLLFGAGYLTYRLLYRP